MPLQGGHLPVYLSPIADYIHTMQDTYPTEHLVVTQGIPLHCRFWQHADALRLCATGPLVMEYGVAESPLGPLLAEWLPQGLCRLSFARQEAIRDARPWPGVAWKENPAGAARLMARIFDASPGAHAAEQPLSLLLRGTAFQLQVWRALLQVPAGRTLSYAELARAADAPGASRAVGTAMARNPIVYLVPCHRVIRSGGDSGNYGGGAALKARMLAEERRQTEHVLP